MGSTTIDRVRTTRSSLPNRSVGAADQKRFELRETALLGRSDKRREKMPFFCRIRGNLLSIGHTLPSAAQKLASIGFFEAKNVRDLTI
jgi:hypothetical protein